MRWWWLRICHVCAFNMYAFKTRAPVGMAIAAVRLLITLPPPRVAEPLVFRTGIPRNPQRFLLLTCHANVARAWARDAGHT